MQSWNKRMVVHGGRVILFIFRAVFIIAPGLIFANCAGFASGGLDGRILDARGVPLAGARVQVDSKRYRTDAGGYFRAESLAPGPRVVRVNHEKYAESFKRIVVRKNENTAFDLRMLRGRVDKLEDLRKPNHVRSARMELHIPANVMVDETGTPARSATLHFAVLDPRGGGARAMPGSFRGVTEDGLKVNLESMGAASIVLRSASGKKLQVQTGKHLVLYMPVMGRVPRGAKSIPMWYLDEKTGLWKNQGKGAIIRRGGRRVVKARLPHLSWWNVDAPYHDKSSIWIKSIVGSDGLFLNNPAVMARGLDYNGISAARPAEGGPGFCVDAKLGSKVELETFYRDDEHFYHRRREIALKHTPSSCSRNPGDGVIIEQMVLQATEFTCARGRVDIADADAAVFARNALRVEFVTAGKYPVVIQSQRVSSDGEFTMKRLPGNVSGRVRLASGPGVREAGGRLVVLKSSSPELDTQSRSGAACRDLGEIKISSEPADCAGNIRKNRHGENFSRSYDLFELKDGSRIRGCVFRGDDKMLYICMKDGKGRAVSADSIKRTKLYVSAKKAP